MNTWKIKGHNKFGEKLPTLLITADSFDKAIRYARTFDKGYCSGQVTKEVNI